MKKAYQVGIIEGAVVTACENVLYSS